MPDPWLSVCIAYLLGLFVAPALPKGRLRRAAELFYAPAVWLGLWYRWSMYAPEAPDHTRLGCPGVVTASGAFEPVTLSGFDPPAPVGGAAGLRYVAFQWALCDPRTDYLKPWVAARALATYRAAHPDGAPVVAEIREVVYPTPPITARHDEPAEPVVRSLFRAPQADAPRPVDAR